MTASPTLTWKLELTEEQLKQAVAEWVSHKFNIAVTPEDVRFQLGYQNQGHDYFDRSPSYDRVERTTIQARENTLPPAGANLPARVGKGM